VQPVVEAEGLVKRYDERVAVDRISFHVEPQECFGFLGPNGAGKTSTMRMIACVSPLTAGILRVLGRDVHADPRGIKSRLGVVPQENNLDPDLTVLQNLLVYARYFDMPASLARQRASEVLDLFHLADRAKSPIADLSGGMRRRLVLARGLLNTPELLILDEPTTGLDPQARHLVWDKVRYLKGRGVTMLLSTHYMDEAEALCDRLIIMHQGRIVAEGRPADLIAAHVGREVIEVRPEPADRARVAGLLRERGMEPEEAGEALYLFGQDGDAVLGWLGSQVRSVVRRATTLEDVFLKLTGRALREE